jgi:Translation initiation factor 2, gamma subunit (eIF-2gamma; GTPase)
MSIDDKNIEINNQPDKNVGLIGHVSNGKSSLVKAITGIATQRHSSEKQRNITIKLGYANVKIFKCNKCSAPSCYQSAPSNKSTKKCNICSSEMILVSHISFVDCPGHSNFMATMLGGTSIMDTSILVEAVNNPVLPAPQTLEHLKAITIGKIPNAFICINKFDLVKKEEGIKNIKLLKNAFDKTILKDSPMIPSSANHGINIDVVCEALARIKPVKRDLESPCNMIVVRSFNINKPGTKIEDLCGGVIGGSILFGKLKIGDDIELRPGHTCENKSENKSDGDSKKSTKQAKWSYKPLKAKVLSINSESNKLEYAIPGGLIGVQLDIDPALTSDDNLVGQILTMADKGYEVYEELAVKYLILTEDGKFIRDTNKTLKKGDMLQLNINACTIPAKIKKVYVEEDVLTLYINKPISVNIPPYDPKKDINLDDKNNRIVICYQNKIFGIGKIIDGLKSKLLV